MAGRLMNIFGGTTRKQLLFIGLILTVLGVVGAVGVMLFPNEEPASLIDETVKNKFYNQVAFWAILSLFLVAVAGILFIGVAITGLPLVHAARYHVGVFYVTVFSLLLIPSALSMRMGAELLSNASMDTSFAEGVTNDAFSSPAGLFAFLIGLVVFALSLLFVLANLFPLARVSYRPSLVRGASLMGAVLVALIVATMAVYPFLTLLDFDYQLGQQGAVGFETFEPKDVMYTHGWIKWLGNGEQSSTYGSISFWSSVNHWFLFFTLLVSVLGFIGLALYSANDRTANAYYLTMTPVASIVLAFMCILFTVAINGAVGDLADSVNVSTENTRFSYGTSQGWLLMVLAVGILTVGAFYTISLRQWLSQVSRGQALADPVSMDSLVDPPTGLPRPPTGWPARWDRMSNGNMAVLGVVVILVLVSFGGYFVKAAADTSSDFTPGPSGEVIILDELPEEESIFNYNDYAAEGATRAVLWQPTGTWFVKEVTMRVTWTDEEAMFRHENQPDTFEAAIYASTGENATAEGASITTTRQGEVTVRIVFDQYILTSDVPGLQVPEGAVTGTVTTNVTCVEAQDQAPSSVGFIIIPDDGNDFSAVVTVSYKLYTRGG